MHQHTSLVYAPGDTPAFVLNPEVGTLQLTSNGSTATLTGARHGDRGAAFAAYLLKLSAESSDLATDILDGLL